ncbi:SDR family oxidoreductase [Bdellovibrio sp. HCB117]|uniref:SDR family oxidoreductase n=1 Tax=Bdellovibrio sp. HCB117 TaxID=3394359 RepID=UPI0039B61134
MNSGKLILTGASGNLGQLTLKALLKRVPGNRIIVTTRTPDKLKDLVQQGVDVRFADFDDVNSLESAFKGGSRLLLISTDRFGDRIKAHKNAVNAAKKAGVKHILYTSLPQAEISPSVVAPDHYATEVAIKESGLTYTFLRNNLYMDNLLMSLKSAVAMGTLYGSAGAGKIAYVSRADCAEAAAGALAEEIYENKIIDITGSEAVSYEDLVKLLSEVLGKTIRYQDLSDSEFAGALIKSGLPEAWAQVFMTFDASARKGSLQSVTTAVKDFAHKEPVLLRQFLSENRAALLN